jgi:glycosyltransferase involved in cell wall biosynthesis
MKNSFVSVIIPCHNYGKYLGEAVDSVLNQTYKNLEIIIINDGSADNTDSVAKQYEKNYSNIRYISQKNLGIVKTRNVVVDQAKGEYLIQLDADDWLDKDYVDKTLQVAKDSKAEIVYTDYKKFGDKTETSDFPDFSLEQLKNRNYIHISCLVKTASIKKFKFDEKLDKLSHEDWELFLNMCLNGNKAKKCSGTFLNYRIHSLGRNNLHESDQHMLNYAKVYAYAIEKHRKDHPKELMYLSGKMFADWYVYADKRLGEMNIHIGNYKEMLKNKDDQLSNLQSELTSIKNSRSWKVIGKISSVRSRLKRLLGLS